MRIKLCFPAAGIDAIKRLGLSQKNPQTLRLVAAPPVGVALYRGKTSELFDCAAFDAAVESFGAWIVCSDAHTAERVREALFATRNAESIKIARGAG